MLTLSLRDVDRGEVRLQEEVPADSPLWEGVPAELRAPVRVELWAQTVGEGVLVRGRIQAEVGMECRRCLTAVTVDIDEPMDILYEPMASEEEEEELSGEVYPLPPRGDVLDVAPAVREQLVLQVPEFVVCSETCRGLCPQCGTKLNEASCSCVADTGGSPWDALKKIEFD